MPWEQIAILVIIALISFVNWVMQKSATHKEARRVQDRINRGELAPAAEEEGFGGEAERAYEAEENRRRFMEALGLPADSPEPAPNQTRLEPVAGDGEIRRGPVRDFLHKVSSDLEARLAPPEPPAVVPPPLVVPRVAPSSRRKVVVKEVAAPTDPGGQLEFLREPGGLQKAVLAQEVLGRCKGLSFGL
jgi:hypothetical protein